MEAFRWTSAGGMVGLGDLGDPTSSVAMASSADGSIVVGWSGTGSGNEAFMWTPAAGMVGLGDLPGGDVSSFARGISADGSIIIGDSKSALGTEVMMWTASGGMLSLGHLPGGIIAFSRAAAVSADGAAIVGVSRSDLGNEAFRWTSGEGMVGLGSLPGGNFSSAFGVSADGATILGQSAGGGAFVWDSVNGMRPLDQLLISLGVDLTGWVDLVQATGISADGKTIVGLGFSGAGRLEAFIAVIPEPSSALLMGLGLIGLGARRRASQVSLVVVDEFARSGPSGRWTGRASIDR